MEAKLTKIKEAELYNQKEKYEKIIEELKAKMAGDQAFLEAELRKKIAELEEKLKEALKGFDSER